MKIKFIIFSLLTLTLCFACNREDEEVNCKIVKNCNLLARPELIDGDCHCSDCTFPGQIFVAENFCTPENSYVALLPEQHDALDTFAIGWSGNIVEHGEQGYYSLARIYHQQKFPTPSVSSPDVYNQYRSYGEGDSVFLDSFPAPTSGRISSSIKTDDYEGLYRLKFEAWLPQRLDSDTIYANIHTLAYSNRPIREPVEFIMFKAK